MALDSQRTIGNHTKYIGGNTLITGPGYGSIGSGYAAHVGSGAIVDVGIW
jgi:hypothetical protein